MNIDVEYEAGFSGLHLVVYGVRCDMGRCRCKTVGELDMGRVVIVKQLVN